MQLNYFTNPIILFAISVVTLSSTSPYKAPYIGMSQRNANANTYQPKRFAKTRPARKKNSRSTYPDKPHRYKKYSLQDPDFKHEQDKLKLSGKRKTKKASEKNPDRFKGKMDHSGRKLRSYNKDSALSEDRFHMELDSAGRVKKRSDETEDSQLSFSEQLEEVQ